MPERWKKAIFIASTFCLSALAFYLGQNFILKNSGFRSPQSIPKTFDYSNLTGTDLSEATSARLIGAARLQKDSEYGVGFSFGNFLVADENRHSVTACEVYSEIEITFVAGDMAVNGEPPQMIVSGPCEVDSSPETIRPLYVLKEQILATAVKDKATRSVADTQTQIRFINVSDEWPTKWVIKNIRLIGPNSQELIVRDTEIKRVHGTSLALDW